MVVYDYIAGEAYVPTKVKLHDPAGEGAKSLYPVTVLGAIVAGLDTEDALATNIANQSNQIKYKYLEPFYQVGNQGKLYNDYLNITFTAGTNKIDSSSLNIFNGEGKIMSDLLPSFVDDVVEVPVLGGTDYPDANLFIRVGENEQGVTTYTFYTKGDNNNWVIGGGETGKIYIAATTGGVGDGSIYRCVTGSTSTAIKISENPYAIDQTVTNGVSLSTDNGNLKAVADSATYGRFGTVKISNTATNNVALTCTDGVVAVSAGVGAPTLPGVVYAVGAQTEIDFIAQNMGSGALAYTVPTADYMQAYVTSVVAGVNFATSNTPGIVQIGSNIDVGSSGLISVNSAAAERWGVVKIVDTIADTAAGNTGNTDKAVTLGGISSYIDRKVAHYQPVLLEGPGIDITTTNNGDVISVSPEAPLTFTNEVLAGNQKLTISDATTGARGVVVLAGAPSDIAQAYTSDGNGHPYAVTPAAVSAYVSSAIVSSAGVPVPTESVRGGIRVSSANTGLDLIGAPQDVLRIKREAPLYINDANNLTISSATLNGSGAVNVVSTAAQIEVEDYAEYVPQNRAIIEYLAGQTFGSTYHFASGTTELEGGTVTAVVDSTNYGWMRLTATGIGVAAATQGSSGVAALETTVEGIEGATTTNATWVPTVSAISKYISSHYQSSGTYQSALNFSSGITSTNNTVTAVVQGRHMILNSNGIGVSSAGSSSYGVVALEPRSLGIASITSVNSEYTPTVEAVSGYVTLKTPTYTSGVSVIVNPETLASTVVASADPAASCMYVSATGIGVSSATASKHGVVKIVETSAAIVSPANSGSVPTASAVNEFVTSKIAEAGAQGTLTPGAGIYIGSSGTVASNFISAIVKAPLISSGSAIALDTTLPLTVSNNKLDIKDASTATRGVVKYASVGAFAAVYPANSAVVMHPMAVASTVVKATDWLNDGEGLTLTSGTFTGVAQDGTSYTYTKASITLDSATYSALGGVQIVSTGAQVSATTNSARVPTNSAIKDYVSTYIGEQAFQSALIPGSGIDISGNVISARLSSDAVSKGGLYFSEGEIALESAGYVDTSDGSAFNNTFIPLGGIRVRSGHGLLINSGVVDLAITDQDSLGGVMVPHSATASGLQVDGSGHLKLNSATTDYLGGIKLKGSQTGLKMGQDAVLSAATLLPVYVDANNQIAVHTASNSTSVGVVGVLSNTAEITAGSGTAHAVPNAAGLINYVSTKVPGTLDGTGLCWSGGQLNVSGVYPIVVDVASDAVTVHTAVAEHGTTLTNGALGVVYVRDVIRDSATITAGTLEANTVPNEKAVRTLVDNTSSAIINTIDNRMYITYTAV